MSLWDVDLSENDQLLKSSEKLTGLEAHLQGYWPFDSPTQFPYVWSDVAGSMTAEIRVLKFDSASDKASLFVKASGTSVADMVQVSRDVATPIELTARAMPPCDRLIFRIVELPRSGELFDSLVNSGKPRGTYKGRIINAKMTDLSGSRVIFEVPRSASNVSAQTSFVYDARCQNQKGVGVPVTVTITIKPVQPYPQLVLSDRLRYEVHMAEIVDPDEDEYNAASTFSLSVSGGRSPSASIDSAITTSASVSQVPAINGSGSSLVIQGTGKSRELNEMVGATVIEVAAENPMTANFELKVVGGTPTSQVGQSIKYQFGHTLIKFPDIGDHSPKEISMDGSTIELSGANFAQGFQCLLGDEIIGEAAFVSPSRLLCEISKRTSTGVITLSVSRASAPFERSNAVTILVKPVFQLWDVFPENRVVYPGSEVIIHGSPMFHNGSVRCRFLGSVEVVPHAVRLDSISCRVPRLDSAINAQLELEISQNLVDFVSVGTVELHSRPVITRLYPPSGYAGAKSQVAHVFGSDFINSSTVLCRIGDFVTAGEYMSPAKVKCTVYAIHARVNQTSVAIDVSFNGAEFTNRPAAFRLKQPALVSAIVPDNGPSSGGTRVRLFGQRFDEDTNYTLTLDGVNVGNAKTVNSSCLEWTTVPINVTGPVQVRLSMDGLDEDSVAEWISFVFTRLPQVQSISPSLVCAKSLSVVTVVGANFGEFSVLTCGFTGALTASAGSDHLWTTKATFVGSSIVECRIPPLAPPGLYNVTISNNAVDFSTTNAVAQVRIYDDVVLSNASLASGPVIGGSKIVLSGRGFIPSLSLACSFGGTRSKAVFVSITEVQCVSPPWDELESSSDLVVPIRISLNGLDFSNSSIEFRYFALPYVDALTPAVVPVNATVAVEASGRYFASFDGVFCRFGGALVVPAQLTENGGIAACSPVVVNFPLGFVEVEVSLNGGNDFTPSAISLFVHDLVQLVQLSVTQLLEGSAAKVVVTGSGFLDTGTIVCAYDYFKVYGEFMTAQQVLCPAPPYLEAGRRYAVGISLNDGRHFSTGPSPSLSVFAMPTFDMISPQAAFSTESAVITVTGLGFITADGIALGIACGFGDLAQTAAKVLSGSELECHAPHVGYLDEQKRVFMQFRIFPAEATVNTSLTFTYLPTVTLTYVNPTTLLADHSTVVFAYGLRFLLNRTYEFMIEDCTVEDVEVIDEFTVVFKVAAPASDAEVDAVPLMISIDGTEFVDTSIMMSLTNSNVSALTTRPAISQSAAPRDASSVVTICGVVPETKRVDDYLCALSWKTNETMTVTATASFAGCLQCALPPSWIAMRTTIQVVHKQTGIEMAAFPFEYYSPLDIDRVWPNTIHPVDTIPSQVTVFGTGFRADLAFTCIFGTLEASSVTVYNSSVAKCTLPVGAEVILQENTTVRLTNNRLDHSSSSVVLRVIREEAELLAVSPTHVLQFASSNITVSGRNFVESVTCCYVSTTDLPIPALVINDTLAVCEIDAVDGNIRTVDISLGLCDGGPRSQRQTLLVLAAPTIERAYPLAGAVEGNIKLTIVGIGFVSYESLFCHFEGIGVVPAARLASDLIECFSPPSGSGRDVSVQVSIDRTIYSSNAVSFTYRDCPIVLSMTPAYGTFEGGTKVTLKGRHFDPRNDVVCQFGQRNFAGNITIMNSTLMVFESPPSSSGLGVESVVCFANGEMIATSLSLEFQYVLTPMAMYTEPNKGFTTATTPIFVHGHGFSKDYPVYCVIGRGTIHAGIVVSEDLVCCEAPPGQIGAVNVRVVLDKNELPPVQEDEYSAMFEYLGKYFMLCLGFSIVTDIEHFTIYSGASTWQASPADGIRARRHKTLNYRRELPADIRSVLHFPARRLFCRAEGTRNLDQSKHDCL